MKALKLRQGGFSILELAVAMTILSAGSAVLWYTLKSSAHLEALNRLHHTAFFAARSEIEKISQMPKSMVHDTEYFFPGPANENLKLKREVFDSTRIVETQKEITLDEKLSPKDLQKPLEVKVQVLFTDSSTNMERQLSIFTTKIPQYQWY